MTAFEEIRNQITRQGIRYFLGFSIVKFCNWSFFAMSKKSLPSPTLSKSHISTRKTPMIIFSCSVDTLITILLYNLKLHQERWESTRRGCLAHTHQSIRVEFSIQHLQFCFRAAWCRASKVRKKQHSTTRRQSDDKLLLWLRLQPCHMILKREM